MVSESDPTRTYIGETSDLTARLTRHNAGRSPHTALFRPWKIQTAVWFADESKAHTFERYLKSGSGRAFASRHF